MPVVRASEASVNRVVSVMAAVPAPVPQPIKFGSVPLPFSLFVVILFPVFAKIVAKSVHPPFKFVYQPHKRVSVPIRDHSERLYGPIGANDGRFNGHLLKLASCLLFHRYFCVTGATNLP